jgi:small conductance mechanosensitive channel
MGARFALWSLLECYSQQYTGGIHQQFSLDDERSRMSQKRHFSALILLWGLLVGGNVFGQVNDTPVAVSNQSDAKQKSLDGEGARAAALKDSLEADRKRLADLKTSITTQEREFEQASEAVAEATKAVNEKQEELDRLTDAGKQDEAAKAAKEVSELRQAESVAKQRLDVALKARKTTQEQINNLETKVAQDQSALDTLLGTATPASVDAPTIDQRSSEAETEAQPTEPDEARESAQPVPPVSEKLAESQRETEEKEAQAEAAAQSVTQIRQRKQTLSRDIELESAALSEARQQQDVLDETLQQQERTYTAKSNEGAPSSDLEQIRKQITETQQKLRDVRSLVRQRTDQLQTLRSQLMGLQAEEIQLIEEAEQKRQEAEAAKRSEWIISLRENAIVRGPKILVALLVIMILRWLTIVIGRRLVKLFSKSGEGERKDREDRAETLGNVFDNAARVAIYIGGTLMILDIVGIPIGPLMGGAAVLGLAIAFGAQSLIKDYFTGFIVLLENQYKLNDFLTIGGISGTVERITLRITVLRDYEGKVHFIPNGQINSVTNHTHGWARAVLDVDVAYHEDVDEVVEVLRELTAEISQTDAWKDDVLAEPEILGVNELRESAVSIRIGVKVRPAKQWALKRELLRRIKKRFDKVGIEIPFPQQTVYHRYEDGQPVGPEQKQHIIE